MALLGYFKLVHRFLIKIGGCFQITKILGLANRDIGFQESLCHVVASRKGTAFNFIGELLMMTSICKHLR